MERIKIASFPTQSMSYLLICAALALAFLLVGIYPSGRAMKQQAEEIVQTQARIEDQKVLQPIYKGLLDRLRNADAADTVLLPKTGLSLDQIDHISSILEGIASKHGLHLMMATPDVKAITKDSKLMAVSIVMRGSFLGFRKVLLDLVELPYLEHTEEMQIQETSEGKEFKLKIWLAIDGTKGDVKT